MFNVVCIVNYLNVSFGRLITSVAGFSAIDNSYFCCCSSSSGCLGHAAIFYCGTPLAFNITILYAIFQMLSPSPEMNFTESQAVSRFT